MPRILVTNDDGVEAPGLLALTAFLANRSDGGNSGGVGGPAGGDRAAAMERHGFHLAEVSGAAGISFTHTAPTFDAQLDHIMPQMAAMGAAVRLGAQARMKARQRCGSSGGESQ